MPHAVTRDGVRLYFEETGAGTPIVFAHELSADLRSWERQVRYLSRRYRCVAFNARGYPPSDVPRARTKYSQRIATDDIADVMRHLGIRRAHVVGCSMGGYAALHFALRYPRRTLSVTAIGAGAGSDPDTRAAFLARVRETAERFERLGIPGAFRGAPIPPGRLALSRKDPRGFAEYQSFSAQLSARGLANTQRGVMLRRPTVQQMKSGLRSLRVPVLVVCGDDDGMCLGPSVMIKRMCPSARLWICPAAGHAVNFEEPELFNEMLLEFLTLVDSGR